ncbi:uncharacterized protein LOC131363875 [Hemibagrus wyckioides]|uniref:uncharacterized protein LOC131363875 n=1 Tax=Hemibagrus wyckioides TaxID=337641 RepID=UPI00266BF6B4|nr:uncharacterized protein LOC131363875 [Hemibagrus wyckioides]
MVTSSKQKQSVALILLMTCLENKNRKKRRRRVWSKSWLGKRGRYGLPILQSELEDTHTHLRRAITAKERLSVTLGHRMGRTTVSRIVQETCEVLYHVLKEKYMKTPVAETEWRDVAKGFQERWKFPHCLGAIDGKHITILPPGNSRSTFRNYKSRFSILLMAIADSQYRFLYANVGTQGRVSDGGLIAHSDLRKAMDQRVFKCSSG